MNKNTLRVQEWRKRNRKTCPTCREASMLPESNECWGCAHKIKVLKSTKIGSYRKRLSLKGRHRSWVNVHIRQFARSWNKNLLKRDCENCGYSKHVQLAHKKPVSSFKDSATLGEVNSPKNLKVLCPNCHWEFDHGLL